MIFGFVVAQIEKPLLAGCADEHECVHFFVGDNGGMAFVWGRVDRNVAEKFFLKPFDFDFGSLNEDERGYDSMWDEMVEELVFQGVFDGGDLVEEHS